MIEVLVLLFGPTLFSILLWSGLKRIASPEMKKIALLAIFVMFSLSIVIWAFFTPDPVGPAPFPSALVAVSTIAFAAAYPVALAMNAFPGIFSEKGEAIAAALVPFISVGFIIKLLISPEVWNGKTYGADYFFIKIPVVGWMIDPFTSGWIHVSGGNDPFPELVLYFGFFIQMTIVMILVFWYFKVTVKDSPGRKNP